MILILETEKRSPKGVLKTGKIKTIPRQKCNEGCVKSASHGPAIPIFDLLYLLVISCCALVSE